MSGKGNAVPRGLNDLSTPVETSTGAMTRQSVALNTVGREWCCIKNLEG